MKLLVSILAVLLLSLGSSLASVYEGFDYPAGSVLNGQSGGTGFSGSWSGSTSFGILPGSFNAPGGSAEGNSLRAGDGTITRRLSESIGISGSTQYLSVATRTVNGGPSRFGLLLNSTTGTGLFVGKPSGANNIVLENEAGGSRVTGPSLGFGGGLNLVLKCEFLAGNDRFTLYVNPIPGQPEPGSGTVKFDSDAGTITNIAFAGVASIFSPADFDELRLSSTYAEALPACPTVTVSPLSLPDGMVSVAYSQSITASDGSAPYTFSLLGNAPPGLMLSSDGLLSGTPTTGGNYSFSVLARDANGCSGSVGYSIDIPCPTITVSPATLPEVIPGTPYSEMLTASGGMAPYTFSLAFGGLPDGIMLSSSGTFSGTATNYGASTFGVFATDAVGCSLLMNYTLEVVPNRWVGDGLANQWNLTDANWRRGMFQNGEDVLFEDTGSNNVPVNISTQVSPGAITVDASKSYLFSGDGGIIGPGGLTKANSGELILATSNSFSGVTRLMAGTLTVQHSHALGMTTEGIRVEGTNAGVHIDGDGLSIAEPLIISVPDFFNFDATNGGLINLAHTNSWSGPITLVHANADTPIAIRSLAGQLTLNSAIPIAGPGALNFRGDGDVVIESGIDSDVSFIQAFGTGTWTFKGTNTSFAPLVVFGGGTAVMAPWALGGGFIRSSFDGTLEVVVADGNLAMNNALMLVGGKFRVTGGTVTYSINGFPQIDNLHGGAIETAATSDRLVINTPINRSGVSCCGTLTFSGLGTVVLNDGVTVQQNGFLGRWRIDGGTVVLNHTNAVSQAAVGLSSGTLQTGMDGGVYYSFELSVGSGTFRPGRNTPGSGVSNYFDTLHLGHLTVAPGANLNTGSTADAGFGTAHLYSDSVLSVENSGGINTRVTVIEGVSEGFGSMRVLTKAGSGTLVLRAGGTYQGGTVINDGTLRVSNPSGSATGSGAVTVDAGATLAGSGSIAGLVTVLSGGTVAPGDSVGTLTISNHLVLETGSTNVMEIDLSAATNDKIVGLSNMTYGGTLVLTLLGATPYADGNAIKLFDAVNYTGTFTSLQPLTPGAGLQWNTSTLAVDGTLRVATAVTPQPFSLTSPTVLPNGSFQFGFSNAPGALFTALASTNVALPLSSWTVLGPITEISPGWFGFADSQATNFSRRFYGTRSP